MDRRDIDEIVRNSGLRPDVVGDLLDKGWTFVAAEGLNEVSFLWVSPTAGIADYIFHEEPHCDGSCGNHAPHRHGLPCNRDCKACGAVCHPECPAYVKES